MADPAKARAKKKKSPVVFILGITILLAICVPYIYYTLLINDYGQKHKPEGYVMPQYSELWKTLVGAVVCQVVRLTVYQLFYPTFYRISKVQDDEELRVRYANKAADKLWGIIYFTVSSCWGWYVLKDLSILPWYLGGPADGSISNISLNTIFSKYPASLMDYSLYTFGYHFGDFLQHVLLNERGNDFEEMLLHHMAAISLYFCYIYGNMLPVGSTIAFLHDLADILGAASKMLNSTIYQNSSVVAFLGCTAVWFFTRILVLPNMIFFIFTCEYQGDLYQFQPYIILNGCFLSIMFLLHCYWFTLFIKMISRFVKEGEAKDVQNDVEADQATNKQSGGAKTTSPSKKGKSEKLE